MTGSTSSTRILQKQIDEKASEKWAIAKFDAVEKDNNETRMIALSAKKNAEKDHACNQVGAIKELREMILKGKNIKIVAVITLTVLILGSLTAMAASHFSVKNQAENNKTAITAVQVTFSSMKQDLKVVSDYVKKQTEEDPEAKEKEREEQIEMTVKALEKVLGKTGKGRRNR